MTLTEQLREEKRKLFGITYVPKQEKAIGEVPDIMKKYIKKTSAILVKYLGGVQTVGQKPVISME